MKTTHLVQRLRRPSPNPLGIRPGWSAALSIAEPVWKAFAEVFEFDYMGAAEFELGAIPEVLKKIASQQEAYSLSSASLQIPKPPYQGCNPHPPVAHIWCRTANLPDVIHTIEKLAVESMEVKRPTYLQNALYPTHWKHYEICGWLELDNGFFFFTDREMAEKTVKLFRP